MTPLRLLLVEDSEDDASLVLRELRRGGFEPDCVRVQSPEAMKEALESSEWEVVISDFRMPRFDAPGALALVREAGSDAPFIVVSGKVGEEAAVEIMRAGAQDCVMKDDLARLCLSVERGMEEARAKRERARAERRLLESEERYRSVVEQATDAIFLLDAKTRHLVEANAAFSRTFGYAPEEVPSLSIYDLVAHGKDDVDATIRRTLKERQRFVGERKYRRKDGSLADVEVGVSVVLHGGREIICTICRDVTGRKESEKTLRESEERFRMAFDSAAIGMALVGLDGRWLRVNRPLCEIVGYTEEELLGLTFQDITHPDDLQSDLGMVERVISGEMRAYQLEKRYVRKDGETVWILLSVALVREDEERPLYFISQIEDITQRKHAETALRESERLYRTVIEQATENIFLVDIGTRRIVESNPAFRQALGYSEEDLREMTLYDVVVADRESVDRNIRRTLAEGRSFAGERMYRRRDGSLLNMEASGSAILRDGRETLVAVAHDVTERARVQALLEERVATLSRIASDLTLNSTVENTLDAMAESVVRASTAVACSVTLIEERTGVLRIEGSYGLPEGFERGIEEVWRDNRLRSVWRGSGERSPTIEAVRSRKRVLADNMKSRMLSNPLYAPVHAVLGEAPWDTVFIVPLVSRGRSLGAINFAYLPGEEPGEDEQVFLEAVADQAAIAVENSRLFSEARGKAALEERQRLSRELHDSVSQALYGIALGAKTARKLLDRDPARAADPLDYVLSLSEAGLAEMRALIFELRPESLESEGLVAALEKQAAAVEARHGISVVADLGEEPEASLESKEAVYRIAQEALNNTIKHARASRVEMRLKRAGEDLLLAVSDDGVGFEQSGDFPGHVGLISMRERASRLGGFLDLDSAPGKGTALRARVPAR